MEASHFRTKFNSYKSKRNVNLNFHKKLINVKRKYLYNKENFDENKILEIFKTNMEKITDNEEYLKFNKSLFNDFYLIDQKSFYNLLEEINFIEITFPYICKYNNFEREDSKLSLEIDSFIDYFLKVYHNLILNDK